MWRHIRQPPAKLKRGLGQALTSEGANPLDSLIVLWNSSFLSKSLNMVLHYKYAILMSAPTCLWVCLIVTLKGHILRLPSIQQWLIWPLICFFFSIVVIVTWHTLISFSWNPYPWTCLEWKFLKRLPFAYCVPQCICSGCLFLCRGLVNAHFLNHL